MKAGTWSCILVLHLDGKDPYTGDIFCCFSGCIRTRLDQKRSNWNSNQWGLNPPCPNTRPYPICFESRIWNQKDQG